MLTKLNIPQKINVGFQNRGDTYTGKLAYVVYTDKSGVLRKEKSWNGWRDQKIDPLEFENKPTSGFVLNKKVGETRWGWNPRKAWVRVYDPRDFEFEISVANLLFILEEASSIKGKGLEGEFVYAWDSAELVLLPVDSQEYKQSVEFTELQTKKIVKTDIKEGFLYKTKDNTQVMYLGRHDWYEKIYNYFYNSYVLHHSKQHVFVTTDGKYWTQTGFAKLATRLSDEPSPTFSDEFEKFKSSENGSKPVKFVSNPTKTTFDNYGSTRCSVYGKIKDEYYPVFISKITRYPTYGSPTYGSHIDYNVRQMKNPAKLLVTVKNQRYNTSDYSEKIISKQELDKLELYTLQIENEAGTLIPI